LEDHGSRTVKTKELARPHLNSKKEKLGMVVHTCHHSFKGRIHRKNAVQAGLVKQETIFEKYIKQKGLLG
jgi:hypothetical protein